MLCNLSPNVLLSVLAMESTTERQTFTVAVLETEISDKALGDGSGGVVVKVSLRSTSGTELASAHTAVAEGSGVLGNVFAIMHTMVTVTLVSRRCTPRQMAR
jgi:hypothetical protein